MRRNQERYPIRWEQERSVSPWGDDWPGSPLFETSPWQVMRRMQEDMDRVFNQFFSPSPWTGQGAQAGTHTAGGLQTWAPNVDVSQNEKEWCIEADLPGVNKDDIDVQVRDNHLILRAEMRKSEQEEPGGGDGPQQGQRQYARRERRYGYFERVIPLPKNVDEEAIGCDFRNGVLTVHIPRSAKDQPGARRIPVQDADRLPSETAAGRIRTPQELGMTENGEARQFAGAKGGETTSRRGKTTTGKKDQT